MEEPTGLRTLATHLNEAKHAPRASETIPAPKRLDLAGSGRLGWNPVPGQAACAASGAVTQSLFPSVIHSVLVPLDPQVSEGHFRTRLPRTGLVALAGLGRTVDRVVSLVREQVAQGFIRHSDLAFPRAPVSAKTGFVARRAVEVMRSPAGAALHEPTGISAPRVIPPLRLTKPAWSDRAAGRACLQRFYLQMVTDGMRPVRGKLYAGVPARLERETVDHELIGEAFIDLPAPALHTMAETVSLQRELRDGKTESEVAPTPVLPWAASSNLASPRLTGLGVCKIPPQGSIGTQAFLTLARNVPIPSTMSQRPPDSGLRHNRAGRPPILLDLAEPCPARSTQYSSLGMLPARSPESEGFRQRPRRRSVEGARHL